MRDYESHQRSRPNMTHDSNLTLVQIKELSPPLNAHLTLYMLEHFGATVKLSSTYPAQDLKVQLWTNALNKFNSEGDWHPIDLAYQSSESNDTYIFQNSFIPTSEGNYQFTYRVGLNNDNTHWQWAGKFQENGYLIVEPPSPLMTWTQGPSCIEILPNFYVGNFIAACQAEELGIDAVLNLGSELTLSFPPDFQISYKKLGALDGAKHPIADEILLEAVNWIDEQIQQGKKKILVNCRAGIGRSGSVSVAYCFYKHPLWSYQQTLQYIWSKKPDIYPHKHLQESLESLFPREN
ncbi:MAG: dual specificity protein phosphatase [Cyanobacteriota bacterium]